MSTAIDISKEVTRRHRDLQRQQSAAQRAAIRPQVEAEEVVKQNAAKHAARVAKGNQAAAVRLANARRAGVPRGPMSDETKAKISAGRRAAIEARKRGAA